MALDLNVQTTVTVRGKSLRLKRDWLHGLWAWVVFDGDKKLGWVLQEFQGTKWAAVPVPTCEDEEYDQIWYEYNNRQEALLFGLTSKED